MTTTYFGFDALTFWMTAMAMAALFPLPDLAVTNKLSPPAIFSVQASWTRVGFWKPHSEIPRSRFSPMAMLWKVVIVAPPLLDLSVTVAAFSPRRNRKYLAILKKVYLLILILILASQELPTHQWFSGRVTDLSRYRGAGSMTAGLFFFFLILHSTDFLLFLLFVQLTFLNIFIYYFLQFFFLERPISICQFGLARPKPSKPVYIWVRSGPEIFWV